MSSSEEDNNNNKNNSNNATNDSSMMQEDNNDDNNDDNADYEVLDIPEADDDTLRVLISTDNHLGYCETDPVRGMDSFAAFEEVMYLAKLHKVDMVLLGGDLFHHNKPSRRTLHKTMEIIRRYTMGPNPVKIQILSDQKTDFRSSTVNYEDSCYSIDLPIFSIHGNHDDPTRDGGNEMLAALDLLSVSNLVNYFGRQDQVDKVEVSPVLIQKGKTRVSLYGLGNMRDERLNRMWQSKKVRFLRPEGAEDANNRDSDEEEDDENKEWFNIFVLHQNRDNTGRGTKNCVHESMIPNWVDLTIFGHEHCSEPLPTESVVGTFRITQPGSSVATSLTAGEAARKHAVILNVRGSQFRLDPIPLTMVRSFVMHDVALTEQVGLKDDDPKIDAKITKFLEEQLRMWIYNARQKGKQLLEDARKAGNNAADANSPLRYRLEKRDEVLVRLRVDHAEFSTLNNQRFGARFVGEVANATDILLFQRNKKKRAQSGKGKGKKSKISDLMDDPVVPVELEQVSIEVLVKENLENADQKLSILSEKDLGLALEEFVEKTEVGAILDKTKSVLKKRQAVLMKSGSADDDGVVSSAKDVQKAMERQSAEDDRAAAKASKRKRSNSNGDDDNDDDSEETGGKENQATASRAKKKSSQSQKSRASQVDSSDDEVVVSTQRSKSKAKATKKTPARNNSGDIRGFLNTSQSQSSKAASTNKRRKKSTSDDEDDFDDDDDIEVVSVKPAAPRRRTAKGKVNYSVDAGSDIDHSKSDSDDMMDDDSPPKKKKAARKGGATRKAASSTSRGKRKGKSQESSFELDEDWGSASTRTQR